MVSETESEEFWRDVYLNTEPLLTVRATSAGAEMMDSIKVSDVSKMMEVLKVLRLCDAWPGDGALGKLCGELMLMLETE